MLKRVFVYGGAGHNWGVIQHTYVSLGDQKENVSYRETSFSPHVTS